MPSSIFLGRSVRALFGSSTTAGTPNNTDETTLATYDIPGGLLATDNSGVRITVWWTQATNGNTKTSRLKFAGTTVGSVASTGSNVSGQITATILRKTATTQTAMSVRSVAGALETTVTSPSGDTAAAITVAFTGQNGSASANDIVFTGMLIEYLPMAA